jgi:hypothetical protein
VERKSRYTVAVKVADKSAPTVTRATVKRMKRLPKDALENRPDNRISIVRPEEIRTYCRLGIEVAEVIAVIVEGNGVLGGDGGFGFRLRGLLAAAGDLMEGVVGGRQMGLSC